MRRAERIGRGWTPETMEQHHRVLQWAAVGRSGMLKPRNGQGAARREAQRPAYDTSHSLCRCREAGLQRSVSQDSQDHNDSLISTCSVLRCTYLNGNIGTPV